MAPDDDVDYHALHNHLAALSRLGAPVLHPRWALLSTRTHRLMADADNQILLDDVVSHARETGRPLAPRALVDALVGVSFSPSHAPAPATAAE